MTVLLATRQVIVPMAEADVDAVSAAEQRSYAFPWSRGNFSDSLKAGHSAWVCRQDGALVGYGLLLMAADEAQLLNITVLPEHQGQGLGSRLLEHLLWVAREHGAGRMFLEVRPSNSAALALYRRFLFSEIGRRRGYYAAPAGREDALVMARAL
jgi:ribosomal-protein-alanine N-acetyltransferase